ncbi:MAG TPA: hypothetical protein VGA86_00305, partial [Desulfatiglandales bacterium]
SKMVSQEVVTPVPGFCRDRVTGVQVFCNPMKKLDSGFRRNDEKGAFRACSRLTRNEDGEQPHAKAQPQVY